MYTYVRDIYMYLCTQIVRYYMYVYIQITTNTSNRRYTRGSNTVLETELVNLLTLMGDQLWGNDVVLYSVT